MRVFLWVLKEVFSKSLMAEVSRSTCQIVLFFKFIKDLTIPGRISDILVDGAGVVLVVLEPFQVLASRDEMYGMPILVRRDSEVTFLIVPAKVFQNPVSKKDVLIHCAEYQVQIQRTA
jgi:hypothetical protein